MVRVSYIEIYQDKIFDLLENDNEQPLELKEHPEKGVYVDELRLVDSNDANAVRTQFEVKFTFFENNLFL